MNILNIFYKHYHVIYEYNEDNYEFGDRRIDYVE